jgi:hypothetical protein
MRQNESGLWVPSSFNFNRRHAAPIVRTIDIPPQLARVIRRAAGTRAKVTQCDARQTWHVETDDGVDAVVRPKNIRLKIRSVT